ncbi:MAG: ATP synthase F1 subunit delta [Clostridiales bacterium]|jgi:F-type H+-transporting ATPase subunit delta|nr:ATP synthase F1 subunit delta [Clostridiales bacterium]
MADMTKPYAAALFDLAVEKGNLDALYQETLIVIDVFQKVRAFTELLKSPFTLPPAEKEALIYKTFPGINKDLAGLMVIMLKKGRETYIEAALKSFIELAREHTGIVTARVISAVALTEEQLAAITSKLSGDTGKRVEIEASVDPSLIGGLLIEAGGKLIDSTIKKQLRLLAKRLA